MFSGNASWTAGSTTLTTSSNMEELVSGGASQLIAAGAQQDLGGILLSSTTTSTMTSAVDVRGIVTGVPRPVDRHLQSVASVVLETVTLCALWVTGIVGNTLVCAVIYRSRRLQSTTNYFVVSLAGADLAYALFVMPFLLAEMLARGWVGGVALCKLVRYIQLVVPVSMVAVLCSICADRFYTIIYPLSFKISRGSAKRMILVSWLLAVSLAAPGLYLYNLEAEMSSADSMQTTKYYCQMYLRSRWENLYVIFLAVSAYFLPIIGMAVGYSRIFRFIWRAGIGGRTFQRTANPVPRSKVKMIKLIIVVNVVIVLLLGPYYVSQLYFCAASGAATSGAVQAKVYIGVIWVFFTNTVAKPVIYLCYNSNFRRGCKEVLCMSSMKCYRSNAYTITSTSTFGKRNHIGVADTECGPPIYGPPDRRVESPTKTFDRTTMVDKIAWPISSQTPSTYL